jgi:hypothetical protein
MGVLIYLSAFIDFPLELLRGLRVLRVEMTDHN